LASHQWKEYEAIAKA